MPSRRIRGCLILLWLALNAHLLACGYRHFSGPLEPAPEDQQLQQMSVLDDGSVVYRRERLEISLRPLTDAEMNRQFSEQSDDGLLSANPYTYGNWVEPESGQTPVRFTVFLLKVKNYSFPKVLVDPQRSRILTEAGREYHPLTLQALEDYFLAYATGYAGNDFRLYDRRRDILRRTLYPMALVFSGQESSGYVVFPRLPPAVRRLRVRLEDVVLRFDYREEPVETESLEYAFERQVGRTVRGLAQ